MKKLLFVGVFAILVGTLCFAGNGSDNGNGGADKIGAYVGWPFGLSYSHEFNDLVGIKDILCGIGLIFKSVPFLPFLIPYYPLLEIRNVLCH